MTMTLIKEIDYGTPKSEAAKMVTLEIDGQAVTVPEGTSIMRAAMELGTKIPKLCATDSMKSLRLLPPLPRRDRRPQGHARLLHDAGRRRHQGQDPDRSPGATAQGRDGALYLRSSARLPHLRRQWRLRIAGHGGRGGLARGALWL